MVVNWVSTSSVEKRIVELIRRWAKTVVDFSVCWFPVQFVVPEFNQSLLDAYNKCRESADAKVCCDYLLQVCLTYWTDRVSREMEMLVKDNGYICLFWNFTMSFMSSFNSSFFIICHSYIYTCIYFFNALSTLFPRGLW